MGGGTLVYFAVTIKLSSRNFFHKSFLADSPLLAQCVKCFMF